MTIKDILVHVDRSERSRARVEIAMQLAQQHGAHLTGLFAEAHTPVSDFVPSHLSPGDTGDAQQTGEAWGQRFQEQARKMEVSAEWRQINQNSLSANDLVEQVILHGRYTDLVIVGQNDPDHNSGSVPADLPDRVVIGVGRPVLVVPYSGDFDLTTVRAMVAWNGGREAVRGVNDALPFLERATKVLVMAVNPEAGSGHGDIPCADICTHLARHGVKAEAQHISAPDVRVGDVLLSRAADEGVNLLVSGAYQKSRMREMMLGGVTRHLLEQMTVPVLMSR